MGILGRMNTVVRSNINELLDKMSDPGKEIDMLVLEMEEAEVQAREELVSALAQVKLTQKRVGGLEGELERWQGRAEQAVRHGEDELAREALKERLAQKKLLDEANAMLAGLGRTRRVILADTLLDGFSPEEIEVIFAHEIGHHVHRHIRKMIVAGLVFSLGGFFVCAQLIAAWVVHTEGRIVYNEFPVHTLPLFLLIVAVLSTLIEPLQNAMSRHFERQSDRYALSRTGDSTAYRSAFEKLARLNKSDPDPHPLEVFLFHGHPPIGERLAMADEPGEGSEGKEGK